MDGTTSHYTRPRFFVSVKDLQCPSNVHGIDRPECQRCFVNSSRVSTHFSGSEVRTSTFRREAGNEAQHGRVADTSASSTTPGVGENGHFFDCVRDVEIKSRAVRRPAPFEGSWVVFATVVCLKAKDYFHWTMLVLSLQGHFRQSPGN